MCKCCAQSVICQISKQLIIEIWFSSNFSKSKQTVKMKVQKREYSLAERENHLTNINAKYIGLMRKRTLLYPLGIQQKTLAWTKWRCLPWGVVFVYLELNYSDQLKIKMLIHFHLLMMCLLFSVWRDWARLLLKAPYLILFFTKVK